MTETKNHPRKIRQEKAILGFCLLPEIGATRARSIINQFSDAAAAWNFNQAHLKNANISPKFFEKILETRNSLNLDKEYEKLQQDEISIITPYIQGSSFPSLLEETPAAPIALFVKGNKDVLDNKQLAIIGTRKPTAYGKQAVEKIGAGICQSGLAITSGLAMGIDSLAHRSALENNCPTIAVLGSGLSEKVLSGSFAYRLAQEIISSGGALVSEYAPDFQANKTTFPMRNRIISGLSLGTLVIEAGERSGSLITAGYALEQNREVFALPGNIFSSQSAGTNKLIKEGATPITSTQDILSTLGFSENAKQASSKKQEIIFSDKLEKAIYRNISHEPIQIDQLIKLSGADHAPLSTKLSLMELNGLIRRVDGGFIRN